MFYPGAEAEPNYRQFDPLRNDPCFQDLLLRIRLEP